MPKRTKDNAHIKVKFEPTPDAEERFAQALVWLIGFAKTKKEFPSEITK